MFCGCLRFPQIFRSHPQIFRNWKAQYLLGFRKIRRIRNFLRVDSEILAVLRREVAGFVQNHQQFVTPFG